MKKNYLFTVIFTVAGLFNLMAQPVLNSNDVSPVAGDVFIFHTFNYMDPGSGGANQTWDFSMISSTGTDTTDVKNAGSSPNASSFPSATLFTKSRGGADEGFWSVSGSAFSFHGLTTPNPSNIVMVYNNPQDYLHYPFQHLNSFTDNFSSTYTVSGFTIYRKGTTVVTADGYGSVKLPYGTLQNVLRVKAISNFSDSTTGNVNQYIDTTVYWYKPLVHSAVLKMQSLTTVGFNTTYTAGYLDQISVGFEEIQSKQLNLDLYPNPTTNNAVVQFNLTSTQAVYINVYDNAGRLVLKQAESAMPGGRNTIHLPTSGLSNGVYMVEFITDNSTVVKKLIKQ